jgi:sugar phosphate isomerase/epimerase
MIGLGSYAFFWQHWEGNPQRLDLAGQLRRTHELGVGLFQICDFAPLDAMDAGELADVRALATDLGIALELGTKGVEPEHLGRYLDLAGRLGAGLVRSMVFAPGSRPSLAEAEAWLTQVLPAFEDAGVRIALETYEQLSSVELVGLVEAVGSPSLGICLDPANAVAALENPRDVIDRTAPYVLNVHVKDFRFTRRGGWVGFTLEGAPLGTGLLDYDHLVDTVRPDERGINRIVEHWLPLGDSLAETLVLEDDWTTRTLAALRSERP